MATLLHSFDSRLFLIALAMVAALLLGGPTSLHRLLLLDIPGRVGRGFLLLLERKLNRSNRSIATRHRRGMLAVLLVLALCVTLGLAVGWIAHHTRWGLVLEAALVALMLPARAGWEMGRDMLRALHEKDKAPAYALAATLSRRDEAPADLHAAVRVSVEYLALQFSRRLVAPVFWYLLLGLPGMLFVTAISVMDRAFASRAMAYGAFSSMTARLDDIMQLLPARIAAFFLAAGALFAPGCNPQRSLRGAVAGGAKTSSPNSGVVLGTAAGALGIALAGPRNFLGAAVGDEWIDFGTARAETAHLARMNYLFAYASCLLALALVALNLRQMPLILPA